MKRCLLFIKKRWVLSTAITIGLLFVFNGSDPTQSFEKRVMKASNRTFLTIADAHLTTLVAAAGLWVFGWEV